MVQTAQSQADRQGGIIFRIVGAALLAAAGAIHLDLYLTGYRTIPTIGWLFLLQVIAAFALAIAVVAIRSWVVSAAGALFALSTLGGYLLSIWVGLFGFKEVRTTAGIVAGAIEVAAFLVLAAASLATMSEAAPGGRAGKLIGDVAARLRSAAPAPGRAAIGVAVVALVLLGVAVGTASAPSASTASGGLRTMTIGGVRVLANSQGRTLYWFAPDNSTQSKCYGSCASYWPPVRGPVTAGSGVQGTFGTIRRTDGTVQATYNGHPLYTYVGDNSPGQARGNNLNLNGGLWHEVAVGA
jgi:predicted lipoprotein with Yx(FWY)xxD motif